MLDETTLGEYLQIPPSGHQFPGRELNVLDACRTVFKNPELTEIDLKPVRLGLHERILHLLVAHNLNARSGRYSEMTHEDLWWMQCIMDERRPDLVAWLIHDMIRGSITKTTMLHYGYVVIEIIRRTHPMLLEGVNTVEPHYKTTFGETSLRRMHYERQSDGTWIFKGLLAASQSDEVQDDAPVSPPVTATTPPEPAAPAPASAAPEPVPAAAPERSEPPLPALPPPLTHSEQIISLLTDLTHRMGTLEEVFGAASLSFDHRICALHTTVQQLQLDAAQFASLTATSLTRIETRLQQFRVVPSTPSHPQSSYGPQPPPHAQRPPASHPSSSQQWRPDPSKFQPVHLPSSPSDSSESS